MKETTPIEFTSLNEEGLLNLSKERLLSLSLPEMKAIQEYYQKISREPTDIEMETIAQTWSEHCKHKTFKGKIDYTEIRSGRHYRKVYDGLLNETVIQATQELSKRFCLSVFEDNAGIIALDKKWGVAFKVETHNHPSALEPYGGAGTGIGGVIRDILGVGLGAKPIANSDVFCVGEFGPDKNSFGSAANILPPERILTRVIDGVRDYGNRMGIPTCNGAVFFHKGYYANPLVFCGTVGLIPRDKIKKKVTSGELIVSIGGKTGRDGIHGATFSSAALEENLSSSLVQIGDAIVEKKAMEVILRAQKENLVSAITDCGAGGYSSAVGELASSSGAKVYLEKVPLKYVGLEPWEIWLSESQERMVLSLPKENLERFQEICQSEDVDCSILGEFTNTGRLELFYLGQIYCDLDLKFLHDGIPRVYKKALWREPEVEPLSVEFPHQAQTGDILKKLLAHPNIASKRWVIHQYDHEVQGRSIVKPFTGLEQSGPNDATVLKTHLDSWRGIALSNGINPLYGEIDPYWMAANNIDEALRNLVAVGGSIDACAILDNFCWGDVNDPEIMGGLVRASLACYDFSKIFGVPFISGKDSLNNTWKDREGNLFSIPATLLISAIGIIKDVRRAVTADFKGAGNWIALIGKTKEEMGGSHAAYVQGWEGGQVPKVEGKSAKNLMRTLSRAMAQGRVRSCHDLSEGGLGVTISEMCIGGGLGAKIDLSHCQVCPSQMQVPWEQLFLFSESSTRWLIELEPKKVNGVKKLFPADSFLLLGRVSKEPVLEVKSKQPLFKLKVQELKKNWESFSRSQE